MPPLLELSATSIILLFVIIGLLLLGVGFFVFYKKHLKERWYLIQQNMLINTLAGVHESAVLVRPNGLLEFINPAAEKLLKYKVRSARGKHFTELFSLMEANTRQVIPWLERVQLTPHEKLSTQVAILHTTSIGDLQVLFSVQKAHYAESDVSAWLLLIRDQTELNALQLRLDYLEQHDPQTLLLNRKSFELRLKLAIEQVQRHGIKHSFCLISMDQFKIINDSMGHNAGDVLIERISRILKEEIDSRRDLLARLGGDEFGILFGENEPSMSLRSAERIRQRLEQYAFEWNKTRHNISSSIAFVPIYKGLNTPNRILSVADAACRVAKSKGGNRIHLYKPNDQDVLKQRGHMVWLGRLKKAFEAGNFKLVAQPIHPLNAVEFQHAFHHYETLIRLYDENNQPVAPDEFIPAAEYYSMMPRLDRWVVHNLIQALTQITQKEPLPVFAVNLSGQSLDESDFLKFVLDEIQQANINPAMLCFEITERVAIHNLDLARKFIKTLKDLGCSFSLDDFATGVSSFGYLKSLPVDYLKIDGSFIKDIINDVVAAEMVRSVNQVGHMMGIKVIAEYVENDQIIQLLREIGVDFGQGYGISKPIPMADVVKQHRI